MFYVWFCWCCLGLPVFARDGFYLLFLGCLLICLADYVYSFKIITFGFTCYLVVLLLGFVEFVWLLLLCLRLGFAILFL